MRSPSEIAADAIRDELYARAAFARLITLPAAQFRAAVGKDPRAQTEFMARHILDYWEDKVCSIPAEHGIELILAARLVCNDGEPHVRCRAEKDLANALRYLGRFAEAGVALRQAATLARRSVASGLFLGIVHFGLLALYEDTDRSDEARTLAQLAILAFENNGALDRAYQVRLYDAAMKCHRGEYVTSLIAHHDAARRAGASGNIHERARQYYNIGIATAG